DELGIFNRGDHAEIGTHEGKTLDNNYSLNTVDICPVGALTSRDFRFKQRVWFLKDFDTVCNGCSTGCNVKVYYNENGLYRVKPNYNKDVNGYWMCDVGRDIYKYVNLENRMLMGAKVLGGRRKDGPAGAVAKDLGQSLQSMKTTGQLNKVAAVITAQNTSEEYDAFLSSLKEVGVKNVYVWVNNPEKHGEFDGILYRGDKNPNTAGMMAALKKHGMEGNWSDLESKIKGKEIETLIVAAPENHSVYTDLAQKIELFKKVPQVAWLAAGAHEGAQDFTWQIPMKTFVEKSGTFVNFNGREQKIKRGTTVVSQALNLQQAATLLAGKELSMEGAHL
ncbi:MAG: NADH dehydrogenase subunit, partial [Bdellovibrionales bacterium]|nr:NADH dehydrogenase subunit [Bdellovibrionales bacterium]